MEEERVPIEETEWVFATRNAHKVKELDAMFHSALGIHVVGLDHFEGLPEIVEDQDTFEGNAIKKAETIAAILGLPVAADDSGLCVDYLKGAPCVHSARYAGPGATDQANNEKLLQALNGVPKEQGGRLSSACSPWRSRKGHADGTRGVQRSHHRGTPGKIWLRL